MLLLLLLVMLLVLVLVWMVLLVWIGLLLVILELSVCRRVPRRKKVSVLILVKEEPPGGLQRLHAAQARVERRRAHCLARHGERGCSVLVLVRRGCLQEREDRLHEVAVDVLALGLSSPPALCPCPRPCPYP